MKIEQGQTEILDDTNIVYDINLGNIISQTQLHHSVTIYDLQKDSTGIVYYDGTLNLISKMMSFENTLTDYLYKEFLFKCKNSTGVFYITTVCPTQGFKVLGMPNIDVNLKNTRLFSFNSTEYFIYPTTKNSTQPVQATFGLQYFDNEAAIE